MDFDNIISPYRASMLKYERGRVQTDGEYKYLFYLYTIECETIKNHMHRAGSHEIQIPTYPLEPSGASRNKSQKCTPSILQLSKKLLSIQWSMPNRL